MGTITLEDIRLQEYTLDELGLLKKLRKEHFGAKPEVCIERARHITTYLRDLADPGEPMVIRYAKAVQYFLSRKEPLFFDDNLLAGTTTAKQFGAPVYPELTGLTIWPELDTISTRAKNPQHLSKEDAEELNFRIFPYWMDRSVLEFARKKNQNPRGMKLFEQLVFFLATKSGCISHTVPCYTVALEKGVNYIIQDAASREAMMRTSGALNGNKNKAEFYQAVQIAMKGIIAYAQNLSRKAAELAEAAADPSRRDHFRAISEVCSRVPAGPSTTFREAVNALWIIQVAIHAENINMAMSPGRLDQILHTYYKNDREAGRLSVNEAMEIVGCLWLKLTDNTNLVPEQAEELFGGAGTVPAVTLGGVDEKGENAVNELTYIMLRVTELLRTRDPSLNARYHYEKNTKEYRARVSEVIATTKAVPAFYNDVAVIQTLENQGATTEHARDYAIIGCVELTPAGRGYDASSAIMFNLVSALELGLYDGKRPVTGDDQIGPKTGNPAGFKTFEDFWNAFTQQIAFLMEEAISLNNAFGKVHQEILPTPLLSAFFEGPMEKGQDLVYGGALYNSSGVTHIGFADTVDSLNAIEKAVFVDKVCSFDDLCRALQADFAGYEKLHSYLTAKAPKYGTEDAIAVKNSQRLVRFLYEFYQSHTNYRGGKYRPSYWTMTNHAGQGRLTGALPNGRRAHQVFASGITPVSQAAVNLAACLKSVGELDCRHIPGGEALNLKFPALSSDEDRSNFGAAVESYMRFGGMHVQFNIMSYEMLLDAKKNPDKYPELLVRVSGYSAYFNDLNEAMKDEIITRTAYDVKTGIAVPFPGGT
jgi:formate C-acetyltransferase